MKDLAKMTKREAQILDRIIKGKINKEIAYDLGIAEQTVKNFVRKLCKKNGCKNRYGLILLAVGVNYRWHVRCLDCRFCHEQWFTEYSGCGPFSFGVCEQDITNRKMVDKSAYRMCRFHKLTNKSAKNKGAVAVKVT